MAHNFNIKTFLVILSCLIAITSRGVKGSIRTAYQQNCTNGVAFAAEEVMSNNNFTVKVTLKNFYNQADQQSLLIDGVRLPTNCGDHFSRCNLSLVTNDTTSTSVLLVPLQQGIAQIEYSHLNETLQFETYCILPLPSQFVNTCQVTTFLDITEFVNQRHITDIIGSLPRIVGICLSENGAVNARLINVTIDFMNVSKSFLSVYNMNSAFSFRVSSPNTMSNFQFTSNIPECWLGNVKSLTNYIHDRSRIGQFDLTGVEGADGYMLLYEGTNQEYHCNNPRQLVRISEQVLIIYCENGSAEIDICNFRANTVEVTNVHEANSETGIPYYCSSDMSSFVTVTNRTIQYGNSSHSVVSHILPLAADEDIYFGDCILKGDNVFFVSTTTQGSTYLFNLSRQDLSEKEVILFMERGVNSTAFVQHRLYFDENIVVYNNGSSTVLYNISCQNSIATIDHQHQLSLVLPSEGQHPCTCHKPTPITDSTTSSPPPTITTARDNNVALITTTPSDDDNNIVTRFSVGKIIGIVFGVFVGIIIVIAILILSLGVLVKRLKNKSGSTNINDVTDKPLKQDLSSSTTV